VIVVTGRMVQSVRRFLAPAELGEPVICYQGAVVADAQGQWLRHEPIPRELAKEALAALKAEGYDPNVYIDDELYVSHLSKAASDYAGAIESMAARMPHWSAPVATAATPLGRSNALPPDGD